MRCEVQRGCSLTFGLLMQGVISADQDGDSRAEFQSIVRAYCPSCRSDFLYLGFTFIPSHSLLACSPSKQVYMSCQFFRIGVSSDRHWLCRTPFNLVKGSAFGQDRPNGTRHFVGHGSHHDVEVPPLQQGLSVRFAQNRPQQHLFMIL